LNVLSSGLIEPRASANVSGSAKATMKVVMRTGAVVVPLLALLVVACNVEALVPDAKPLRPDAPPIPADAPYGCHLGSLASKSATVAGCEQNGAIDGDRIATRFSNPVNVAMVPGEMAMYVADFDNHRVRKLTFDGTSTTIIDQSKMPAGQMFMFPFGLAVAADGTLYVETDNNATGEHSSNTGAIWRWNPSSSVVELVMQNVGRPRGLLVLADGKLLLADHIHHVIELLDPISKSIAIVAGSNNVLGNDNGPGLSARFREPYHVAKLNATTVAVTELTGHRVRLLSLNNGAVTVATLVGNGTAGNVDGPAANATLNGPQGIAVASDGAIYITELGNFGIRKIKDGMVSTIAGAGSAGFVEDDDLRKAKFYGLEGMALSADEKTLYVADGTRGEQRLPFHRIRAIKIAP
jgi:sugar lactone lactonase YvrE